MSYFSSLPTRGSKRTTSLAEPLQPSHFSEVHALELAHAAKLNLGTAWGVGESCVPGPEPHHRTGGLSGSGYVAVAGPKPEATGVLRLEPSDLSRSANMMRIAQAALDLMAHLQEKQLAHCSECGRRLLPTEGRPWCYCATNSHGVVLLAQCRLIRVLRHGSL